MASKKKLIEDAIVDVKQGMNALEFLLITLTEAEPPARSKTTKKKKEEKKPQPVEEDLVDDLVEDDDEEFLIEDEEESKPTITRKQVQEEFKTFLSKYKDLKKGREMAKKVCKKFGANGTKDLDEKHFEDVIKILKTKK